MEQEKKDFNKESYLNQLSTTEVHKLGLPTIIFEKKTQTEVKDLKEFPQDVNIIRGYEKVLDGFIVGIDKFRKDVCRGKKCKYRNAGCPPHAPMACILAEMLEELKKKK